MTLRQVPVRGLAAALAATLSGGAAAQEGELHIYNWTGYIAPEMVEKFEAETGIDVVLDTYDSNETLLAKLTSGAEGYDIAVPSGTYLPVLIEQGLIQPMNASELPNYGNLAERWTNADIDPGNIYSVVWNWGTTSVVVDTAVYDGPLDSLGVVFDPPEPLQGQVGMSGSMSEVISLALVYLGLPQCSSAPEDLEALATLLEAQEPFVKVYDASGVAELLGSGELSASQAWSGAAYQARQERPSLHYVYPQEGVYGWADFLVIPATAANPEAARAFVNFLMDPENAGILSSYTGSPNGIPASAEFLPEEVASAPEFAVPDDAEVHFGELCSDETVQAYSRLWARVRG